MYSSQVRYFLMHPVNGRAGDHYNGAGEEESETKCLTNPERVIKNLIKFKVCIERNRVLEANWQVFGDPVARAVASWCVKNMEGMDIPDIVNNVIPERAVMELNITDQLAIRGACMPVFKALVSAFNDYKNTHDERGFLLEPIVP